MSRNAYYSRDIPHHPTLITSAVKCQIYKASLFAWNNSGHKMNKKDTITGNFFSSKFNEPFLPLFLSAYTTCKAKDWYN